MRASRFVLASSVALAAGGAVAADPSAPGAPAENPSLDVYGHLLATPDRTLMESNGMKLALRAAGGDATTALPFGPPQPVFHDIQTFFNIDARSTSFLIRAVPPPTREGPPTPGGETK
jgi:hypothetical protein